MGGGDAPAVVRRGGGGRGRSGRRRGRRGGRRGGGRRGGGGGGRAAARRLLHQARHGLPRVRAPEGLRDRLRDRLRRADGAPEQVAEAAAAAAPPAAAGAAEDGGQPQLHAVAGPRLGLLREPPEVRAREVRRGDGGVRVRQAVGAEAARVGRVRDLANAADGLAQLGLGAVVRPLGRGRGEPHQVAAGELRLGDPGGLGELQAWRVRRPMRGATRRRGGEGGEGGEQRKGSGVGRVGSGRVE